METHYFIPTDSLGVTLSEESVVTISMWGSDNSYTGVRKVTKKEYDEYTKKVKARHDKRR
jgi:hypothetical protein